MNKLSAIEEVVQQTLVVEQVKGVNGKDTAEICFCLCSLYVCIHMFISFILSTQPMSFELYSKIIAKLLIKNGTDVFSVLFVCQVYWMPYV